MGWWREDKSVRSLKEARLALETALLKLESARLKKELQDLRKALYLRQRNYLIARLSAANLTQRIPVPSNDTEKIGELNNELLFILQEHSLGDVQVRRKAKWAFECLMELDSSVYDRYANEMSQKAGGLLCSRCFCRLVKCKLRPSTMRPIDYYACRQCHGLSYIEDVAKVVAVLGRSVEGLLVHKNATLFVNWFRYMEPFDFHEIWIVDADDFDIEELVMKLRNDADKRRRRGYRALPVYLRAEHQLSQSKLNLLKDSCNSVNPLPKEMVSQLQPKREAS